jgi:chromosome segregation ATPase
MSETQRAITELKDQLAVLERASHAQEAALEAMRAELSARDAERDDIFSRHAGALGSAEREAMQRFGAISIGVDSALHGELEEWERSRQRIQARVSAQEKHIAARRALQRSLRDQLAGLESAGVA